MARRHIHRAEQCGATGYQQCPDPDFPSGFCCPENTNCISLDDASTAICCPLMSECKKIAPIICDIQQQNITFNPKTVVKTTKLDVPLPECGKGCCPHGYVCHDNGTCLRDDDKASYLPSTTPSLSEAVPTASAITSESDDSTITTAGLLVGFFPGIVVGVIIAAAAYVLWRKKRARKSSSSLLQDSLHVRKRSDGSLIGSISGPIPIAVQDPVRTDFIRRHTPPADDGNDNGTLSILRRTRTRVRSLFSVPRYIDPDPPPVPPLPEQYRTHHLPDIHLNGSPRYEDIPVRTPPEQDNPSQDPNQDQGQTRPYSPLQPPEPAIPASRRTTTFTEMLERAGVGGFRNDQGNLFYRLSETPEPNPRGHQS